jgi:hypothetical protein
MGQDYRPGSIVDCDPQRFRLFSHGLPVKKAPRRGGSARGQSAGLWEDLLALMLFKVVTTEKQLDINVDKIPLERGAGRHHEGRQAHCRQPRRGRDVWEATRSRHASYPRSH